MSQVLSISLNGDERSERHDMQNMGEQDTANREKVKIDLSPASALEVRPKPMKCGKKTRAIARFLVAS